MERCLLTVALVAASGCWTEEPLIHGAFTDEQWTALQAEYRVPPLDFTCNPYAVPAAQGRSYDCDAAAIFGQQLFFEPRLSFGEGTSCSSCHATTWPNEKQDPAWYVDIRADNAVSMGAVKTTPHNTISLVNVDVPIGLDADGYPTYRQHYGWTGQTKLKSTDELSECSTPSDVITKIAIPKAMESDASTVSAVIRDTPAYVDAYVRAFGPNASLDNASLYENAVVALAMYMRRLVSLDAPFDAFIAGDDAAISDSAKRGFALFLGRAMCSECHRGPMFTDDKPHVTGVSDPNLEGGRNGSEGFFTPTLRNVVKTAPYMHKGTLQKLGDVLDFYNRGGGTWGGYGGHLDPLMHPLDLSPEEAEDLQAFLLTLTGAPVPATLRKDTHAL